MGALLFLTFTLVISSYPTASGDRYATWLSGIRSSLPFAGNSAAFLVIVWSCSPVVIVRLTRRYLSLFRKKERP